jgi:hypothetical protein
MTSKDEKALFSNAWRMLDGEMCTVSRYGEFEPEYRFIAETLGTGRGLRKRIERTSSEWGVALHDWRFDFAMERYSLAVEVDGGQYIVRHGARGGVAVGGRHNTDADRYKINVATSMGWRVLRFSVQALKMDPASCIAVVLFALYVARGG